MSNLYDIKHSINNFKTTINENLVVIAIIPAYNESNNIIKIIENTKKFVNEIIVIDDGSTDDTYEKDLSTSAKVYRNNHNRGKGAALRRGLVESFRFNPDIIVTMDADGQHSPEDIPNLLKPIKEKQADIVIGSRYHEKSINEIPLRRGMGLSVINILNKALIKSKIKDSQSGFRAYNKVIFSLIPDYDSNGYGAETEQLAHAESYGVNIVEIPVSIKYRGLQNTSKKNSFSHGFHLLSTIVKIAIEKRPLQFFGIGGLILIVASIIPLINLLIIFNDTRYFSIPLALIVLGLVFNGTLLIVIAFILYVLKKIRNKLSKLY